VSIAIDVSADGVRVPIARSRVADIARNVLVAEGVREAMLSITFLGPRAMGALNRRHLGHRGATDVISFGFTGTGDRGPIIGDIYVAPDVARDNARRYAVGLREEIARLVVHGVLHVLGYDHAEGEARVASPMWNRQETLLARVLSGARA
jgi:probable rRNA maturation factor